MEKIHTQRDAFMSKSRTSIDSDSESHTVSITTQHHPNSDLLHPIPHQNQSQPITFEEFKTSPAFPIKQNPNRPNIILEDFHKRPIRERALQKLEADFCDQYINSVINSIREVLTSDDTEGKGEIFIHLLKTINEIGSTECYPCDPNERGGTRITNREKLLLKLFQLTQSLNQAKYFQGLDLSHLDMREIQFNDPNFIGINLDLSRAKFIGANLDFANMSNTILNEAIFVNAEMNHIILTNATMLGADLTQADMKFAELANANLTDGILILTNLSCANISKANFTHADLDRANLDGALKKGTIMAGVKNYVRSNTKDIIEITTETDPENTVYRVEVTCFPERLPKDPHPKCCIIS